MKFTVDYGKYGDGDKIVFTAELLYVLYLLDNKSYYYNRSYNFYGNLFDKILSISL